MAIKKKAMVFTIISVILISILVFSFTLYNKYSLRDKSVVTGTRVKSMDNFIMDIENDIERGVYITGFRAIMSMEQYITTNGKFIGDFQPRFMEAFLNGTINNSKMALMNESTFVNWTDKVKFEAEKLDINLDFDINDVIIYHDDPWEVKVYVDIKINVKDKKNTASWDRDVKITTNISIEEFEDALYSINSNGKVTNKIIKTTITDFVDGEDATNLQIHLNNSYYIESETAPSFLMRLAGNLSSSPYGIESLVNIEEFKSQGFQTKSRSVVDYIYFGTQSTDNCQIENMPLWFMLDDNHLSAYECNCVE
ncbi:MAG: hypothetical protein PHV16_01345 [Candidatus Nanoarchaeia archaeon]|nr:hypothetical protein [Candidatus Nanoarchaeia archaeon]